MDDCQYSDRNGSYGGQAGYKDGIIYNGGYWIVKYPKAVRDIQGGRTSVSYTTSPLSEYVGSHIYQILGYKTHDTLLCYRKGKIAVACHDFCEHRGDLMEMRTIKNAGNEMLSEELQTEFTSSNTGDRVNLKELLIHYERNPLLRDIQGITEHFWETALIDILIDNGDRNNGNRGLLFDETTKTYSIAPVYDNGNSFSNKTSERRLKEIMSNKDRLTELALGSRTAYVIDGHQISAKKFVQIQDKELQKALQKVIPLVQEHKQQIIEMIQEIPETYMGIQVCSDTQKQFMLSSMELRLEHLLEPAINKKKEKQDKPLGPDILEKIAQIKKAYEESCAYAAEFSNAGSFSQRTMELITKQTQKEKLCSDLLEELFRKAPEQKNEIKRELVKSIPVKMVVSAENRIRKNRSRETHER